MSTYKIADRKKETRVAKQQFAQLTRFVYRSKENISNNKQRNIRKKSNIDDSNVNNNLKLLEEKNSDLFGWISIPDSEIEYPVMKNGKVRDFYLTHNFDREKNRHGVPFLDYRCKTDSGKENFIVYAHHMRDGTMFAGLTKYKDENYYKKHKYIMFTCLGRTSMYEVCFVCKVNAENDTGLFEYLLGQSTSEEEKLYKKQLEEKKLYSCELQVSEKKNLLTLATCEYSKENTRLIIIAKRN